MISSIIEVDIFHAVVEWVLVFNRILYTLTQALQSSGVDMSQATVSVQIDVGRRAKTGLTPSTSSSKVCLYSLHFLAKQFFFRILNDFS